MKRLKLLAAALLAASALPALAIGTLADVRVYDRAAGRELPVYWHEGRAYVVGKPGNEYSVTVRNSAGEDLLAVTSVDGVNVMSGETATSRQSGYVLSPWASVDVKGWRKSMDQVAAFYFTSLGDSYAGRTGRPDNVGVIGVAVFRRKYEAPPQAFAPHVYPAPMRDYNKERSSSDSLSSRAQPEMERSSPAPSLSFGPQGGSLAAPREEAKRLMTPGAPLGTGHGRREESPIRWVNFERASEHPAETITIYYDSYRNLVARGILQQPVARRDPQPFPGFAPDPWR
jgi:hypothetical protein